MSEIIEEIKKQILSQSIYTYKTEEDARTDLKNVVDHGEGEYGLMYGYQRYSVRGNKYWSDPASPILYITNDEPYVIKEAYIWDFYGDEDP